MKNRFFAKCENIVLRGMILISIVLLLSVFAYAAVTLVGFTGIAANTFYPGETNRVVYQFNITDNGTGDTLSSVEITNAGTADQPGDISAVKLWYQAAGGTFDGISAQYVATLSRTSVKTWSGSSINYPVVTGSSFYVTVDVSSAPTNNSTTKFSIAKNMIVFTAGGKFPTAARTNASSQTIVNIDKLYVYYESTASPVIVKGQSDAPVMNLKFRNSSASAAVSVNSLVLTSVNHAGETAADAVFSGFRVKDGSEVTMGYSAAGAPPQTVIALSPSFTVPAGGSEVVLKIYADISAAANTYDAGLKISSVMDIVTADSNTTEAYSGYAFPMVSGRSEIKDAAGSVNVFFISTAPGTAAKGQQGISMMSLTLGHPSPVTTYSSVRVNGITVTASSSPALAINQYLSSLALFIGAEEYGRLSALPSGNEAAVVLSRELLIEPGGSVTLDLKTDSTAGSSCDNFALAVSAQGKINCTDAVSGSSAAASGTFPFTSGLTDLQQSATGVSLLHANKMPSYAARGQELVYCEDLVFTHLNSGNYSSVEAAGVTLTVENEIGAGVVPSEVITRVLITDSYGNTLSDYTQIPVSGSRVFIDFNSPLVIPAGTSRTAKVYMSISSAPSESYIKLGINSSTALRCLDANSKQQLPVLAAAGDAFPMKTSAVQIVDPATAVHGYRFDTLQASVNRGQGNAYLTGMYFINPALGIAAVNSLKIGVFDAGGASLNASQYINSLVVEKTSNTSVVYAIVPVVTTDAYIDLPFTQPLTLNPGAANAVSVTVRAVMKHDAPLGYIRAGLHQDFASASDYTSGLPISAVKKPDGAVFQSSLCMVEDRGQTLSVSYDGANLGAASKGDASVHFISVGFHNPGPAGTSALYVTGITLTAEEGVFPGPVISDASASSVFSKVYADNASNTAQVFGEKAAPFAGSAVYLPFSVPVYVSAGSSVTVNVRADISTSAAVGFYRFNLKTAYDVSGKDANELLGVTVTAASGFAFPGMASSFVNIVSSDKLTVSRSSISPAKASTSQKSTPLISFTFGNASDAPVAVNGLTLAVKADGLDAAASEIFERVYAVDGSGNTLLSLIASGLTQAGSSPLTLTMPLEIQASQSGVLAFYADLKAAVPAVTYNISLLSQAEVDALPSTLNVQAAAGMEFPMSSSSVIVQAAAAAGGIYHTDVIPTTVSTGQTDIFAEILSIANINPPGSAAITLAGITLTVEDDTNNIINPSLAVKRVLIRDDTKIYAFMTSIPSAAAPFFIAFTEPLTLETAQAADLRVYVDITDTLTSGTFRASISVSGDIRLLDANSGTTITAQAINGDSFPMKTSVVIIQEKAYACLASHDSTAPASANRGQQQVPLLKVTLENVGGASGANEIVTRLNLFTEDLGGAGLVPKDALSSVYVRDGSGALYGSVSQIPDYGDMISIGLTTPVTLRPGQPFEVFIYADIAPAAPAAGFRVLLKTGSNITVRDANSYQIILGQAKSGYSFPMKSGAVLVQNRANTVEIAHASLLGATVNKGDINSAALFFEISNPAPAGYSAAVFTGITITVDSGSGSGLVPSSVLSGIKISADNGPSYLPADLVPGYGSSVYIRLVPEPQIPAGGAVRVTVYADISPSASELYFRLGLKQPSDAGMKDANENLAITQVNPAPLHSFPMNSITATINSAPGIQAAVTASSPPFVTAGQEALAAGYRFYNIGSFAEEVLGLTLNAASAGDIIEAVAVLDDGGNTIMSRSVGTGEGPSLYLGLESLPLVIQPQDYNELYVYAAYRHVTYQAGMVYSLNASGIKTEVPVTAASGNSFPLLSSVTVQPQSSGISAVFTDLMPPAASTGQKDIYAAAVSIHNPSPAGYSAVMINSVSVEIKDGQGNTIAAQKAVSKMSVYGLSGLYGSAAAAGSHVIEVIFSQPVNLAPGASDELYAVFDAADFSSQPVSGFSVMFGQDSFSASDANSGNTLTVSADYPFDTSSALIQKAADVLNITGVSVMPSVISTGQKNINALKLVIEGDGATTTASIMVTRINLTTLGAGGLQISSASCVSKARISSALSEAGGAMPSVSAKITLNLTSPVIVPSGQQVTVYAGFDALDAIDSASFMLSVESQADIYAVDANSFSPVAGINASFPLRPSAVSYQNAAGFAGIISEPLLQPAVTRGDTGLDVLKLVISNPASAGSAALEISGLTLNAYGVSGQPLQAVSAISELRVENESSLVLSQVSPGFSDLIYAHFNSPVTVSPGNEVTLIIKADVSGAASAEGFSLAAASAGSLNIYDVNSGAKPQFTGSALPFNSGTAYIYDAPAQQLYAWHDGTSFAPGQAGRGQKNIKFMSLSLLNPGSAGTSNAFARGVTMYVVDASGNTLSPADIFDFIKISDLTGTYYYGGATASAVASPGPVYAEFTPHYSAPASNTVTVYFSGDISDSASITSFRLVIESGNSIGAYDVINGSIPVYPYPVTGSFPMTTPITSVIATTNILTVGHEPLMPVSAEKGRQRLDALALRFESDTQFDTSVEGITITVKNRAGAMISAAAVITDLYITDVSGNTVYGSAAAGSDSRVYVPLSGLTVLSYRSAELKVSLDVSQSASVPFMVEFEGPEALKTGISVLLQAASGEYFGNMKSGTVSIQEADFESSFRIYPSPFNPETGSAVISYYLPEDSIVTIRIYTPEGREVAVVCEKQNKNTGLQSSDRWEGRNSSSARVRSGVYVCIIEAEPVSGGPKKIIKKVIGVLK